MSEVQKSEAAEPPLMLWVLVAEDEDDDYFFLHRAVSKATDKVRLVRAENGEEAMHYLQEHLANPPVLVVTDLKMPVIDGFGLLAWLKSNPTLAKIPVLIWSGSESPQDREKTNKLSAAAYHAKGISHEGLAPIVAQICAAVLTSPRG